MEDFIKQVEPNLWSDERIDEFCGFEDKNNEDNKNSYLYLMIVFSCLSLIFLIIIVFLIIKGIKTKERLSINKEGLLKSSASE